MKGLKTKGEGEKALSRIAQPRAGERGWHANEDRRFLAGLAPRDRDQGNRAVNCNSSRERERERERKSLLSHRSN